MQRATISTKCADLDEEMPRLLGVTKSILQNVIFCHQEDSNWPLSEASVLKKKFDDIFDATRYTKALDNIKTIRKERNVELKVSQAELDSLKTDRDRADHLKEKKEKLAKTLSDKESRLQDLDDEIRRVTKENKQFYDKAVKFREVVNQAETLEEKKKLHHQNREALRSTMVDIDESDEELRRRKDSFQDHLERQRTHRSNMLRRTEAKKEELSGVESQYSKKLSERGALENDQKHHEEAVAQRQQNIREMSVELGIRGFDVVGLSDSQVGDFKHRLTDSANSAQQSLHNFKASSSSREAEVSNKYQELRNERSSKASSRESSVTHAKRIKDRLKQAQDQLDGATVTQTDITAAKEAYEDDLNKVEKLRKDLDESAYDEQLRKKANEIRELDDRREELTTELNTLNRHAEFRAKLDMKKKDSEHKGASAHSLIDRNASAYEKLTGQSPVLNTFESALSSCASSQERQVAQAEQEEAEKTRAVQHLESRLSVCHSQLAEKQAQLSTLEKSIKDFLDNEDEAITTVEDAVAAAEKELETLNEDLSSGSHAHDLFSRILANGQSNHSCLGCGRGIQDDELAAFEKYVVSKIKQLSPEGRNELEETIEEWKRALAEARKLLHSEDIAQSLKEVEIPKLQEEVSKLENDLHKRSEEAEQAAKVLRDLREQQQSISSLKRVAQEVTRLINEAEALRKEVATLESDLASTGSVKTGDEVQNAINDLADNIKRLKREQQTVERYRDSKKTELSNAERACFRSERIVSEKAQENDRRIALQNRLDELRAEVSETNDTIKRLDSDIDGLSRPIASSKEELEALKSDNAQEEDRLRGEADKIESRMRVLQDLDDRVSRFTLARGHQKLDDCNQAISRLQEQIQAIQDEMKVIEGDAAKIDRDLNESKSTERNILDNLRYRELGRDLTRIDEELSQLDLDSASIARQEFELKYHDQKQVENSLNGEAQRLSGEISSLKEQIAARNEELRTDYKDIGPRFSRKLVEVKTSELANADLERYSKALDQAIIHFHGLKMQEINEHIRYLWSKTYQGSDIDSISIESDNEKVGNRSYNYRVCMMKDTVKMDMRGRCSAGQKVLASIIIRLALADSFATNCRFMALDEPTLCLDHETVSALARSLADIIKERPRTQLIVVTHDQDFLSMLATHAAVDQYWRVGRDGLNSYIERERVR